MSELLKINVSAHTEKKGQLTYLSWAWAWAEVLKIDPAASWNVIEYAGLPCMILPDGSAMVRVYVTIKGDTKSCVLPVMDNRNNAIKNPDARKISDAIMRCLAKAVAMHGLGLYIYAGEDLPEAAPDPEAAKREEREAELRELALFLVDCHQHEKDGDAIRVWYDEKTWSPAVEDRSEEQKYVWGLLKHESKLRSTIKANLPERLAAAAREKEAA
jgi:hypothetical protein